MGEIRAKVFLENDKDATKRLETDALIDTGAVMLLLPQDIVETLGLEMTDKVIVTLANNEKVELPVAGTLSLSIQGRKMKTDCLVGPPQSEPLVGQIILERLDLLLDPLKKTITARPESPYLPSLKLK